MADEFEIPEDPIVEESDLDEGEEVILPEDNYDEEAES